MRHMQSEGGELVEEGGNWFKQMAPNLRNDFDIVCI